MQNSNNMYELDYTTNQVALMLGVHRDTIMYWEENKLIPIPRRNSRNNYRTYNYEEIMEIASIRGIGVVDVDAVERSKNMRKNEKRIKNS